MTQSVAMMAQNRGSFLKSSVGSSVGISAVSLDSFCLLIEVEGGAFDSSLDRAEEPVLSAIFRLLAQAEIGRFSVLRVMIGRLFWLVYRAADSLELAWTDRGFNRALLWGSVWWVRKRTGNRGNIVSTSVKQRKRLMRTQPSERRRCEYFQVSFILFKVSEGNGISV